MASCDKGLLLTATTLVTLTLSITSSEVTRIGVLIKVPANTPGNTEPLTVMVRLSPEVKVPSAQRASKAPVQYVPQPEEVSGSASFCLWKLNSAGTVKNTSTVFTGTPYIKDNSNEATMVVWEGAKRLEKRLGQKKD